MRPNDCHTEINIFLEPNPRNPSNNVTQGEGITTPQVIGCGYRYVTSLKSDLFFPSWLIRFKNKDSTKYYYQWRSKKDFLLLSRYYVQLKSKSSPPFPKSAFGKLSDPLIVPSNDFDDEICPCRGWIRPLGDTQVMNEALAAISEHYGNIHVIAKPMHVIPTSESNGNNVYHRKMFKSVLQMDQFLYETACVYFREKGQLRQIQTVQDAKDQREHAWTYFCREEDTANLIPGKNKLCYDVESDKIQLKERTNASHLGQYFANPQTVKQVIDTTFHWMQNLWKLNPSQYTIHSGETLIFVEPSCGDGRILSYLHSAAPSSLILAYDIDMEAVESCKQRHSTSNKLLSIHCRNFLSLSRQDIINDAITQQKQTGMQSVPYDESTPLVFIGGPPYSAGKGAEIDRSLPRSFIRHCILNLQATFVSFILPVRCATEAQHLQRELNSCIRREDESVANSLEWCYATEHLINSEFEFWGSCQKVVQPSVIQCWFMASKETKLNVTNDLSL